MITERKENKEPRAEDISSYNVDDINDYFNKHSKNLQIKAIQSQATALVAPLKPYSKSE